MQMLGRDQEISMKSGQDWERIQSEASKCEFGDRINLKMQTKQTKICKFPNKIITYKEVNPNNVQEGHMYRSFLLRWLKVKLQVAFSSCNKS